MRNDQALVPSSSPGARNPNKLQNLRPGQGGEARAKHGRSLASKLRRYLESSKGVDAKGRDRRDQIFANLVEIAIDKKHPHAVAAAQVLFDRAYGKLKATDEEQQGGFQVVFVESGGLENVPHIKKPPEHKPEFPDFIDAEIVPEP